MKQNNFLSLKGLILLVLASFLLTVSSCDNDDDLNPTLITIKVPDYYLGNSEEYYAVASDNNGDVLDFERLKSGETIALESSGYKGNSFTLSFIVKDRAIGRSILGGDSYYDIKRGATINFAFQDAGEIENDTYHEVQFDLTGFDANASYYYFYSNGYNAYVGPGYTSIYPNFSEEKSRVFVTKYDNQGQLVAFSFPTAAYSAYQVHPFNLATVTTAFSTETVSLPANTNASVYVSGLMNSANGVHDFGSLYSTANGGSINIKYAPGFDRYSSETNLSGNDFYAYIFDKDSRYNFSVPTYSVTLEATGPSLAYTIEGGGDWAYLDIDYNNTAGGSNSYDLDVYVPVGSNNVVNLVKLPQEIVGTLSDYNYNNWDFDLYPEIVDYEDFSNASEFLAAASEPDFNYYHHNFSMVEIDVEGSARKESADKNNFKHSVMPHIKRASK